MFLLFASTESFLEKVSLGKGHTRKRALFSEFNCQRLHYRMKGSSLFTPKMNKSQVLLYSSRIRIIYNVVYHLLQGRVYLVKGCHGVETTKNLGSVSFRMAFLLSHINNIIKCSIVINWLFC